MKKKVILITGVPSKVDIVLKRFRRFFTNGDLELKLNPKKFSRDDNSEEIEKLNELVAQKDEEIAKLQTFLSQFAETTDNITEDENQDENPDENLDSEDQEDQKEEESEKRLNAKDAIAAIKACETEEELIALNYKDDDRTSVKSAYYKKLNDLVLG